MPANSTKSNPATAVTLRKIVTDSATDLTDKVTKAIDSSMEQAVNVKNEEDFSIVKVEPVECTDETEELVRGYEPEEISADHSLFQLHFVTSNKPHKCTVCGKGYKREIGLTTHMRLHKSKRVYVKQEHPKTRSMGRTKQFLPEPTDNIEAICDVCQKSFYSKSNLTVHMRIHTGEKPYECGICPKAFTQKVYLTAHERVHTGAKPFKCSLCSKSFAQKSYLRTHLIVHTGVRYHICKVCGKGCAHTGDLNNHMRIHTGEKPYQCVECSKCFTQSIHLKSHMKIHTGEKPYGCEICGSKYTEKRYLKRHMLVHVDVPFNCADNLTNAQNQIHRNDSVFEPTIVVKSEELQPGANGNAESTFAAYNIDQNVIKEEQEADLMSDSLVNDFIKAEPAESDCE